ncbi:MAG: DUF2252 family protein [Reyranellales bacterium]
MTDKTGASYALVADRPSVLRAHQHFKMARSAHAYVRGATAKFYEWLEQSNGHKIPDGPALWICGDCHLGNLGPVADAKGRVSIQIRDLDQTVVGNPAHDVIRLGLSLATAARGSDLPGVTTAHIVEHLMDGYESGLAPDGEKEWVDAPEPVTAVMKKALQRRWKHLAEERIEDLKPEIPLGRRFWPLSREERAEIATLGASESVRQLITHLRSRDDSAAIEVLDAAYWVKGCSSLGRLRYAVLVRVRSRQKGGKAANQDEVCLLDIKEAVNAAAPRFVDAPGYEMPVDSAERVVMGARALSPALGNRMIAASFLGKPVVVRELLPQDLKLEIDRLTRAQACKAARFLGHVVGLAHARQLSPADRQAWKQVLRQNRSADLDAPHWMWTSIVDLVGAHERAYLHHCRQYALAGPGEGGQAAAN